MLNSDSEHLNDLKTEFESILKANNSKSMISELQHVTMDEEQVSQMIDNVKNNSLKNQDISPNPNQ